MNAKGIKFSEAIHAAYEGGVFTDYKVYYQMEFPANSQIPDASTWMLQTTGGGNIITGLADRRLYYSGTNTPAHSIHRPYQFGVNNACSSGSTSGAVYPVYTATYGDSECSGALAFGFTDNNSGSTGWDDWQDGAGMGDEWAVEGVGAHAYRGYASFIALR